MQIIPVQCDSLIDMLISWLFLEIIDIFFNLPLITSSLMNLLVQTSNHSPKNSDRDMLASRTYGNSHQTRKWVTPLVLFGFKTQQQPWSPMHKTKNRKILNHHHSTGRTKTHMTTMSQGNKKITTRKILATNNKVLVCTGSLHFFKKYRQPIIKFWSVPVPVHETVQFLLGPNIFL